MSTFARHFSRHIPPRRAETAAGELFLVGVILAVLLTAVFVALVPDHFFAEPSVRSFLGWTWRTPA